MVLYIIICLNLLALIFLCFLFRTQKIILAIFIILNTFIVKTYIVQAFKIPAGSMKPTMLIGDRILANKYIYFFSEPKRGDIVIFPFPEEPSKNFIKRIVGIGGDIIEIRDKQVFINNELHQENYIFYQDSRILPKNVQPRDNFGPIKIPEDSLFVMGDNRDRSYDSRFWGFVKKSTVKGKAVSIYWSLDRDHNSVRWDRVGKNIQ